MYYKMIRYLLLHLGSIFLYYFVFVFFIHSLNLHRETDAGYFLSPCTRGNSSLDKDEVKKTERKIKEPAGSVINNEMGSLDNHLAGRRNWRLKSITGII